MFTGLIERTGTVAALRRTASGAELRLAAGEDFAAGLGDSVAVNGCCLTVTRQEEGHLCFDLLEETLRVTNLGLLAPGRLVNLERALLPTARLGGHFVQGHIDTTAEVLSFAASGKDYRLEWSLPASHRQYVVARGSICLDGISLTVAEVGEGSGVVWVIPHTRAVTTLQERQAGDRLNVEFDLLAKYVERMLAVRA